MSFVVAKTRQNFMYANTTLVNFGVGAVAGLADQVKNLGISRVLIVTDKFLSETDNCKAMVESLKKAGCNPGVWNEVMPDPTDTIVNKGAEYYLQGKYDGLIAIGGGSHMDTAKGMGVVALNGGKVTDYFYNVLPAPAPITKMPPLICIPTTSGTGSEVTTVSIITAEGRKLGILNPMIGPKVALVDPSLTITLPPTQTASTGLDALMHAIEGYLSLIATPITDALALYAIELISKNLRQAVFNGADLEARSNMSLAATIAGYVVGSCYAIAGHAAGQAVGGKFHILHGFSCALPMPAILEYNLPACEEKLSRIASAMGVNTVGMSQREAAYAAIDELALLISDLDIPTLAEATGMTDADVDEIASYAVQDACSALNPKPWTPQTYALILRKTLGLVK